jgi:hypothetical protein
MKDNWIVWLFLDDWYEEELFDIKEWYEFKKKYLIDNRYKRRFLYILDLKK